MSGFEYNWISVDNVESVELVTPEDSGYRSFKQSMYDDTDIPEERRRLIHKNTIGVFEDILAELTVRDPDDILLSILTDKKALPDWVANKDEVIEDLKTNDLYSDFDPGLSYHPDELTRGDCFRSQNDDYRNGEENICCFYCSSKDNRRPKKFTVDDDWGENCSLGRSVEIRQELIECIGFDENTELGQYFSNSGLEVNDIINELSGSEIQRSIAVNVAFNAAFPNEEYYYQRAEALLRDIDSDLAEESGPGQGGREFEETAIWKLNQRYNLIDETVFEIYFEHDAPSIVWNDFISDTSEPTYKEADAIIEDDVGNIVIDFFTSRNENEKRKQVCNYVELYEKATGDSAKAWAVTDETKAELVTIDTALEFSGSDIDQTQL